MNAADMNAEVVATVNGRSVTRGELTDAFNRVCDMQNWKQPIDASIVLTGTTAEIGHQMLLITEAVRFFAGCTPRIAMYGPSLNGERVRVTAVGYYAAVGA